MKWPAHYAEWPGIVLAMQGAATTSDGGSECRHAPAQRFYATPGPADHPNSRQATMKKPEEIAAKQLGMPYEALDERTQKVARHIAGRKHIARNTVTEFDARTTTGQRAADLVAGFGGSWTFIMIFAVVLVAWVGLNSLILARYNTSFDPYPYILLNLVLSMLAAIQAPIILMSQNRQAEKDRLSAEHDYEVNLKAELEIMLLHEKLDLLREGQWGELLAIQKEQLSLLAGLIEKGKTNPEEKPT